MRIAITADPMIPVPPENYGGIERVIDFLVKGLQQKGHEVILVAHRESKVNCNLISYPTSDQNISSHLKNIWSVAQLRQFKPDLIHSFSRMAYLLPFFTSSVPKIMSYQRVPTLAQIKRSMHLVSSKSLSFTGCSNFISDQIGAHAPVETIYNGVELGLYQANFSAEANNALVFLGRIEPIKGPHIAIEIALKSNRKLIVAGNIPPEYIDYYHHKIASFLNDQIVYVGPVNDKQKNELLRNVTALLMPIQWNEPFGIVMAEAMACGTPVIGFNKGSVPEVVQHGKTGFICSNSNEMIDAVSKIEQIDRKLVRKECETRFSSDVIVNQYLDLYQRKLKCQKE